MFRLSGEWEMFAPPSEVDRYIRLRYFVGRGDAAAGASPAWFATELVMPAHREDRLRLLQAFRDARRDKALNIARSRFREDLLSRDLSQPEQIDPATLRDDLAPVARYFARRFARDRLLDGERVVRIEIWYGFAPNPPPGAASYLGSPEARQGILRGYYGGPVEDHRRVSGYASYLSAEVEGDITWVLEYYEE
jgi:hypothetical protein